jgi:hypothetical protein
MAVQEELWGEQHHPGKLLIYLCLYYVDIFAHVVRSTMEFSKKSVIAMCIKSSVES